MMHIHIRRKAEGAMKNGQSRETGNIGNAEGAMKNEQSRETGNIGNKTQNEDIHTK